MQALGPNQEKWLTALESGNYEQGVYALHTVFRGKSSFCCLGVACEVLGGGVSKYLREGARTYEYDDASIYAPDAIVERLALRSCSGTLFSTDNGELGTLAGMNDNGTSFAEIAKLIRSNPAIAFTEPK